MWEAWPFVVVFIAWGIGYAFGHLIGYRRGQTAERTRISFWMTPLTGGKTYGSLEHGIEYVALDGE